MDGDVVSIFGTGCCGDINHVDPVRKDRNKTDFIGGALGRTITNNVTKLRPAKKHRASCQAGHGQVAAAEGHH